MVCELFVMGGVALYALLAVFVLLAFWATEHDAHPGGTLATMLAFLGAWLLFGDLGTLAASDLYGLAWKVPAYLCVGLAWSFPRWALWLRKVLREYQASKTAFLAEPHQVEWYSSYEFSWYRSQYGIDFFSGRFVPPSFAKNRQRMVNWVLLWPFSVLWTFARDGVYRIADFAVGCFGGLHQRLSDWMFKGVD